MAEKPAFTDKDRLEFNRIQKALLVLQNDLNTAIGAGLTEVQPLCEVCDQELERIKSVKATYFPGKP